LLGIPELQPGHFIELDGLGDQLKNKFYIQRIRHILSKDGTYDTRITAISASIEDSGLSSLGNLAGGLL
ncbi:MAG: hypothetical protein ACI4FV_10215, partial [Lachnospiraceae bacterium]